AMEQQQRRSRAGAAEAGVEGETIARYCELVEEFGPTEFVGYGDYEAKSRVLAVIGDEAFLDRTPFYAESGGQMGDTGTINTDTGTAEVVDTTYAIAGQLIRHHVTLVEGELHPGQEALARIDAERREAIRRNHTGTHLLHWALREVLGT